jgi:hypothetical protein
MQVHVPFAGFAATPWPGSGRALRSGGLRVGEAVTTAARR